jgi:hypothetical protein
MACAVASSAVEKPIRFRPDTGCRCQRGNKTGFLQPKPLFKKVKYSGSRRRETLDMAPGGVLQRGAREIYDRIDAVGEAAADLLVNTEDEDNAMTGHIDKPCPQNIANAARQYEIVVPFAAS